MKLARILLTPHEERWKVRDRGMERGWRRQTEMNRKRLGLDPVSLLGHTVHLPQCEVAGQCLYTIIS